MKKIIFKILLSLVLIYGISCASPRLFARQDEELAGLTKEVMQAKTNLQAQEIINRVVLQVKGMHSSVEFLWLFHKILVRHKYTLEHL